MKRLLVPSSALLWGLQFAFLNPALALLLVSLFNATAGDVGWVLVVYNASAFVASWLVPAYADRRQNYLSPMLACGVLTLALCGLLAATTSLPVAVVGLIALGGPAGVGSSLLFAHLKHSGASLTDSMNTRAIVSFAWVAGPPLATFIMGTLGNRAILLAIGAVAVLNIGTTAAMISRRPRHPAEREALAGSDGDSQPMSKRAIAAVFLGFIALQAANRSAVSIMAPTDHSPPRTGLWPLRQRRAPRRHRLRGRDRHWVDDGARLSRRLRRQCRTHRSGTGRAHHGRAQTRSTPAAWPGCAGTASPGTASARTASPAPPVGAAISSSGGV